MARRAHKKSRNGCLECKRRHVKCDEKRPICSNCTASERECEYGTRLPSAPPRRTSASRRNPTPSISPRTDTDTPIQSQYQSQSPGPIPGAYNDQPVNMLHVELFHNLYTKLHTTFDPTRSITWFSEIFSHAIKTQYLVNETLAFSALHMSTQAKTREERDYYHYHAAQLQTHALDLFKQSGSQVNQETCVPLFLFSSILGIHMLCDTLIYRDSGDGDGDFDPFLSRFTHYLRLHHGVRAICGSAWEMLNESVIAPAFDVGVALYKSQGRKLAPHLQRLLDFITSANLGADLTNNYKRSIESLQTCTDVSESSNPFHNGVNCVTTWPVLVPLEFSEALEMRKPEALVILAHWAVLLYRYRDSWLFGDSGEFIIEQVNRYLASNRSFWEDGEEKGWMDWPRGVLTGDR
ncbi:uncharacterized protein BDV17DRAFT_260915 [Aspergillus undulatus]|uniref:uncharacterized protein n=1 Tax=Aspergillus undulatus TaxID=1810928 RepID=UPI003CCDD0CD